MHYPRPDRVMATYHVLDALSRTSPLASSTKAEDHKETFVLRHGDRDCQNIFCDPETGEVTSIIDWERTSTVPRYVG
jgi:aminoglycoside phosphotransferase (APT) family kinase protein